MRILNIRESTWLNATPGAAWRRVLSLEEWPTWTGEFAEARWVGRRGWRSGHRFRLVPSGPHRSFLPFLGAGTVSWVDSEQEVRWVGRFLALRVEFSLGLVAEGLGTRVEFRSTVRGLAVRIVGQETVVRALGGFQRRFLGDLREAGELVGAR